MKKILLLVLMGIMLASIANASGLTMKEGDKNLVDCKFINLDTCYYDIDCIDYEKIKDSDYCQRNHYQDSAIYRPIKKTNIDIKIYDPEPCYDTSCGNCTNDQIKYNDKCLQKNEYCNEKFGANVQWSDETKDCACHSGYDWKVSGDNTYCALAPKPAAITPVPVIAPVPPIVNVPKIEAKPAPVVVETPKVKPVAIKDEIKPVEPVLEVEDTVVEATSSESVQPSPQIETTSEPAPVEPIITPEPKKEPNFVVRFFSVIAGWWKGLWR
ncbi:MAG: hypothetical protein WA093_05165 [Minisyncoccales bacterium]